MFFSRCIKISTTEYEMKFPINAPANEIQLQTIMQKHGRRQEMPRSKQIWSRRWKYLISARHEKEGKTYCYCFDCYELIRKLTATKPVVPSHIQLTRLAYYVTIIAATFCQIAVNSCICIMTSADQVIIAYLMHFLCH